jgi:adenosine kinase
MISYARICREKGVPYICDPGQSLSKWDGGSLREWLHGSTALISNDYELELVMKMTGLKKDALLELTEKIITTLGENGSVIHFSGSDIKIPAAKASGVVDPTGAGDAYRAGLLKGMTSGRDIETSARMGAVAAVYAIEHYGTQEHAYTYEEFVERYRSNFGEL